MKLPEYFNGVIACPYCRAESIAEESTEPTNEGMQSFLCENCNESLVFEGGLLTALPKQLVKGAESNLDFYEKEAQANQDCIFISRSGSRNHISKEQKVLSTIGEARRSDGSRVLELGTAVGDHAAAYINKGWKYYGVDISTGLLRTAQSMYPVLLDHSLIAAEAEHLPVAAESMDAVVAVATLHHLPDPGAGLKELFRVLRPGGRFCFIEPRRYYPTHFLAYLMSPESEISAMKMSGRNIRKWLRDCGVTEFKSEPLVFTPNRPEFLVNVYSAIDRALLAVRFLHFLSVMFCVSGIKDE